MPILQRLHDGIEERHGRGQGLLLHLRARGLHVLGRFRRYEHIEWSRVTRLVFVCTGNICRSAYGEVRARELGLRSASFGLRASSGDRSDPDLSMAAERRGVSMVKHRARCREEIHLEGGDLLIAMEPWQAQELEAWASFSHAQVTLLGLWSQPKRPHLQDPFGLSMPYIETCLSVIDQAVARFARELTGSKSVLPTEAFRGSAC